MLVGQEQVAAMVSMTKHNRRILTLAAAILVIAGVGAFVLRHREDCVTKQNCELIKPGMGRTDVEVILGRPPDCLNFEPLTRSGEAGFAEQVRDVAFTLDWIEGEDTISVGFNMTGEMTEA
jgi:hypothetical protein